MFFRIIRRRIVRRRVARRGTRKQYLLHKEQARILVKSRLEYFNLYYKFPIKKIFIKNQRSRWGSCSSKGNLNFNYKIALLPPELADYLVVHELCHLGEFNHSSAFWALVAETLPDWENRRAALKKIHI
jgi:predicted metal-dependent hydrolase